MTTYTKIETTLLNALLDGEFHSHNDLKARAIGRRHTSPSLIPTHVGRLKRKLKTHTIEHVTGRGYRLIAKEITHEQP